MSKIPITCDGCGAVMHGSVCEYCGRDYSSGFSAIEVKRDEMAGDLYMLSLLMNVGVVTPSEARDYVSAVKIKE